MKPVSRKALIFWKLLCIGIAFIPLLILLYLEIHNLISSWFCLYAAAVAPGFVLGIIFIKTRTVFALHTTALAGLSVIFHLFFTGRIRLFMDEGASYLIMSLIIPACLIASCLFFLMFYSLEKRLPSTLTTRPLISKYGDKFNHDDDAPGYDADVQDESNPVRTGYRALLTWIGSQIEPGGTIIDLGCGTGNAILEFPAMKSIIAVDISRKMLAIAMAKLEQRPDVCFIRKDLLAFCDGFRGTADVVTSAYALHHLTPDERRVLFGLICAFLSPGGSLVCGDLMWEDEARKSELYKKYPELADDFDKEFYWDLPKETAGLESLGFTVEAKRFSDLSWGIRAQKPSA